MLRLQQAADINPLKLTFDDWFSAAKAKNM